MSRERDHIFGFFSVWVCLCFCGCFLCPLNVSPYTYNLSYEASLHYTRGMEYYDRHFYKESLDELYSSVLYDPTFAPAYNAIGTTLITYFDMYSSATTTVLDSPSFFSSIVPIACPNSTTLTSLPFCDNMISYFYEKAATIAEKMNDLDTYVTSLTNAGRSLIQKEGGKYHVPTVLQSIAYYDRALEKTPLYIDALYHKGASYILLGYFAQAENLFQQVLQIQPSHLQSCMDMGRIEFERGNLVKAIYYQDKVLELKPDISNQIGALCNKGQFFKELSYIEQALASFEAALTLRPESTFILTLILAAKRQLCKYKNFASLQERLQALTLEELKMKCSTSVTVYDATLMPFTPRERKAISACASQKYKQNSMPFVFDFVRSFDGELRNETKLHIGYLSYDYRNHPMGHLTVGAFEDANRDRYHVSAYSYGHNDHSEWRKRIKTAADRFEDIKGVSDIEATDLIYRQKVHILVDFMAHTKGARPNLIAMRPAPIVINYLGYPGTTGSTYTDYIIVDNVIAQAEYATAYFSEHLLYLPYTYQLNQYDYHIPLYSEEEKEEFWVYQRVEIRKNGAILAEDVTLQQERTENRFVNKERMLQRMQTPPLLTLNPTRYPVFNQENDTIPFILKTHARAKQEESFDLMFSWLKSIPKHYFIFCNFNTINKMEEEALHVWASILQRVPNSVLLLLKANSVIKDDIQGNILLTLQSRGISPGRVVFLPYLTKREHLERLQFAHLFLDSFIWGAHTTGADALFMNVPIVTIAGDGFPARVAASLLKTIHFETLITYDKKEYEDLAVSLAMNRSLYETIRQKLQTNSIVTSLYDTSRRVAELETMYRVVWELYVASMQVKNINGMSSRKGTQQTNGTRRNYRSNIIINPNSGSHGEEARNNRLKTIYERLIAFEVKGQYQLAEQGYSRILRVFPQNRAFLYRMAVISLQQEKFQKALEYINKCIKLKKNAPLYVELKGDIYIAMNNIVRGLSNYRKALYLNPTAELLKKYITLAGENDADLLRVCETLSQNNLIEDIETKEILYMEYSFLLSKVGKHQEAVAYLSNALYRENQMAQTHIMPNAWYNLAILMQNVQGAEAAGPIFQKALLGDVMTLYATKGRLIKKNPRLSNRKTVVIYCNEFNQTWWPNWGPSFVNKGIGGSEESVIFLSQQLVMLGYYVEVYADPLVEDQGKGPRMVFSGTRIRLMIIRK